MWHSAARNYGLSICLFESYTTPYEERQEAIGEHWAAMRGAGMACPGEYGIWLQQMSRCQHIMARPDTQYSKPQQVVLTIPKDCGCWNDESKVVVVKRGSLCPRCYSLLQAFNEIAICPSCEEIFILPKGR